MTYTGNVTVGGPADLRELPGLAISKLAVGRYDNNAYLLRCTATDEQVLIDAAAEPDRLVDLVGPSGLRAVVTTHSHPDHWQALGEVVAATGATTYAHHDDAGDIPARIDVELSDGDEVAVGRCRLRVVHLVGHTPGSIALVYDDPDGRPHCFTGDCLFPGGVGSDDEPGRLRLALRRGGAQAVRRAARRDVGLPRRTGSDTTLGTERPQLEEWRQRGW